MIGDHEIEWQKWRMHVGKEGFLSLDSNTEAV